MPTPTEDRKESGRLIELSCMCCDHSFAVDLDAESTPEEWQQLCRLLQCVGCPAYPDHSLKPVLDCRFTGQSPVAEDL